MNNIYEDKIKKIVADFYEKYRFEFVDEQLLKKFRDFVSNELADESIKHCAIETGFDYKTQTITLKFKLIRR